MKIGLYIPCFNAADTIKFCLEGVFRQTLPPQEVIVVDDGSRDATATIASSFPVRIISHVDNLGLAAARNTAIKNLDTEFIASLDADCIPDAKWLENLTGAFISPQVAGSGGRLLETYSSSVFDDWRKTHMKQEWGEGENNPPFLFGANTVLRRQALLEVGLYKLEFRNNYEDVDLSKRLKDKGYSLAYEPKAVVHHYKSDDFYSLFNTYWRWHFPYYLENGYYSSQEKFVYKIKDNLGLANRYLEEDLLAERYTLLYLDILLSLHHSWKDFEYFASQGKRKTRPELISFWLSFLDLNLFYHLGIEKNNLSTLLPESNYLLENFFALQFLLFRHNQKFFSSGLKRIIFRDLLLSVYKVKDEYLLDSLAAVNELSPDRSALIKKTHPYLSLSFLKNLSEGFEEWLKKPVFNSNNMADLIEMAASKT